MPSSGAFVCSDFVSFVVKALSQRIISLLWRNHLPVTVLFLAHRQFSSSNCYSTAEFAPQQARMEPRRLEMCECGRGEGETGAGQFASPFRRTSTADAGGLNRSKEMRAIVAHAAKDLR